MSSVIKVTRPKEKSKRITMTNNEYDIINVPIEQIHLEINNPYPINELSEMIESIKEVGLEQNLVVKEKDGEFILVTGHKRYSAIKEILKDNDEKFQHLNYVAVKVIPEDENEIITNLRKHETNLQARSLLKLEESEKLNIIEDYMFWIDKARKEKLEINGEIIKGKTREIIAERFNIDVKTAQKLITNIKNKEKGVQSGHPSKTEVSNIEKVEKIIAKLSKELDKLSADELEEILHSDSIIEEKNNIFLSLFQSKTRV